MLIFVVVAVVATLGPSVLSGAVQEAAPGGIAFSSTRSGNADIWTVNPDDTGLTRITTSSAGDYDPAWSPDGSSLAFTSKRNGNFEIYVKEGSDLASAPAKRVTNNTAKDTDPTWSPDGQSIAFVSNRKINQEIFVIPAAGCPRGSGTSCPTRLTDSRHHDRQPAWSPDGSQIAFASRRDGNYNIYVIPVGGCPAQSKTQCPTRLTSDKGHDLDPAWSPDGSQIAFASKRKGERDADFQVYLMNADGSGQRKLTFFKGDDRRPSWSPDAGHIAFVRKDRTGMLWSMNSRGGEPRRLAQSRAHDRDPNWAPDPAPVLFSAIMATADPFEPATYQVSDLEVVTASKSTGGSPRTATASCPSGKFATGGGGFATQTIAAVYQSFPVGDPATSWRVTAGYNGPEGRVPGSIAFTLTAYVVCARFTSSEGEVSVSTATSAGTISENTGNQLASEARCGNRGRAIGGGFSNESGRRHLESGLIGDVDSVFGASGWRTAAPSSFGDPEDLKSYAICVGGAIEGLEMVEATVANREAIRTTNAYCPPGKHALAGGFSINLIDGYEWWQTPEGTGPIGWRESSWGWTSFFRTLSRYVNMGFDQLGTTKAICAPIGE